MDELSHWQRRGLEALDSHLPLVKTVEMAEPCASVSVPALFQNSDTSAAVAHDIC